MDDGVSGALAAGTRGFHPWYGVGWRAKKVREGAAGHGFGRGQAMHGRRGP